MKGNTLKLSNSIIVKESSRRKTISQVMDVNATLSLENKRRIENDKFKRVLLLIFFKPQKRSLELIHCLLFSSSHKQEEGGELGGPVHYG